MMTRISKPDVSETDVSPKKMNIQKKPHRYFAKPDKIARSYKGGRYGLCHDNPVSTFHKRWVAVLQGEHPIEIVGRHEYLCTSGYGCHTATPPRNEHFPWGTILARFCQFISQ